MKRIFILLSIFTIAIIAFLDARDRINSLNKVAANTPSQVELNQSMPKPNAKFESTPPYHKFNNQNLKLNEQINQNASNQKKQFSNVQKRRDTITVPQN